MAPLALAARINTGPVGAATPHDTGLQVVVSNAGMKKIRTIDPIDMSIIAEAGATIMADQGLGLICVSEISIRRQLADGTLMSVLEDYVSLSVTFRVLWPSIHQLSPKLRAFLDFLADELFPGAKSA